MKVFSFIPFLSGVISLVSSSEISSINHTKQRRLGNEIPNTLCLDDRATESDIKKLQCTASDVQFSSVIVFDVVDSNTDITLPEENGSFQCNLGQAITIKIQNFTIDSNAERYDIGLWIANLGGNAKTGTMCTQYNFDTTEFLASSQDPILSDGDSCGDVIGNDIAILDPPIVLDTICDGTDDKATISYCTAWKSKADSADCDIDSPAGTLPDPTSKCKCGEAPFKNIVVNFPSEAPTSGPSLSADPSSTPSAIPSLSVEPSATPSVVPSSSLDPSASPSAVPSSSLDPSATPSDVPSLSFAPSKTPSNTPSLSSHPSSMPTILCNVASNEPTGKGKGKGGKGKGGKGKGGKGKDGTLDDGTTDIICPDDEVIVDGGKGKGGKGKDGKKRNRFRGRRNM